MAVQHEEAPPSHKRGRKRRKGARVEEAEASSTSPTSFPTEPPPPQSADGVTAAASTTSSSFSPPTAAIGGSRALANGHVQSGAASPSPSLYPVNSRVLVEQHGKWFEARVIEVRGEEAMTEADDVENGRYFMVHYMGWAKKWDMWVGWKETKWWTEAAAEEAKDFNRRVDEDIKMQGRKPSKAQMKNSAAHHEEGEPRHSSSSVEDVAESEPSGAPSSVALSPLQKCCQLPGPLRRRLLSDWQWVTRKRHILTLPRQPSVASLLSSFLSSIRSGAERDITTEVIAGLLIYFERSVGSILLYRIERPQMSQLHSHATTSTLTPHTRKQRGEGEERKESSHPEPKGKKKRPSAPVEEAVVDPLESTLIPHTQAMQLLYPTTTSSSSSSPSSSHSQRRLCCVYGVEHLLRFLVKLPSLLSESDLLPHQISAFTSTVSALIRWLNEREGELFATAAYTFVDKHYLVQLNPKDCRDEPTTADETQPSHHSKAETNHAGEEAEAVEEEQS